jgi:putative permease
MTTTSNSAPHKVLLALLPLAAVLAAGYAIRHTLSTFLFSFVLAYLLDPLVTLCERRNIRRIYGIGLLYVVLGIVSLFCLIYFIPLLTLRWESLIRDLPRYFQKAKEILHLLEERVQPAYAAEEWGWLLDNVSGNLESAFSKVGTLFYAFVGNMAFNLFNIILAPILVFFMLYYKQAIAADIVTWIPLRRREAITALGREINESIGGYVRGQLIVSAIVAVLSTAALLLLDIDYPLLNGIFAGLASVLPFVGVILATLPPLFFAFIKFQSGAMLFKVVAAFAAIYFLEGYVVKPLVFKKSMDLNPLVTILAVMAFGEFLGFWGILLAVPIVAAFKIVSVHLQRGDLTARE